VKANLNCKNVEKLREEESRKTVINPRKWTEFEGKRPALQVEQVKTGHFEAIYEENVWKLKPSSNDQNAKFGVEYLFFVANPSWEVGLHSVVGHHNLPYVPVPHLKERCLVLNSSFLFGKVSDFFLRHFETDTACRVPTRRSI
jgi:hypothetical protein